FFFFLKLQSGLFRCRAVFTRGAKEPLEIVEVAVEFAPYCIVGAWDVSWDLFYYRERKIAHFCYVFISLWKQNKGCLFQSLTSELWLTAGTLVETWRGREVYYDDFNPGLTGKMFPPPAPILG
ncbi:unnamed protein product, partial [Ixodes pacificus]